MNHSDLIDNYLEVVNKELKDAIINSIFLIGKLLNKESISPDELEILQIVELLSRGLMVCNNDDVVNNKFLLTGMNPSYVHDGKELYPFSKGDSYTLREATKDSRKNSFWWKKRDQFGTLCDEIAYIDLFPLRETHQDEGFEKLFRENNAFRGKLLEITQQYIQDLSPRLIVHANRSSMYYWGTNTDWMGYKLHKIETILDGMPDCITNERLKKFPIYRIEGYTGHPERINKGKENNNMIGSYLIEYVMEYRNDDDQKLLYKEDEENKEWSKIFDWVMNQK